MPVPGGFEQNIYAALAQEACERPVVLGEPLQLARRDEGAGIGQRRGAAQRAHQPRHPVEHRMRPALELALVEDERAGFQHQPAEDAGIAEGGGERGDGAQARAEQYAIFRTVGDRVGAVQGRQ